MACDSSPYDEGFAITPGEDVTASHESGFYDDAFELKLRPQFDSLEIRYTLDGTLPDEASTLYTGTITIDDNAPPHSPISEIPTTPMEGRWQLQQFIWKAPENVPYARVVRYRSYNEFGEAVGKTYTKTFFVGTENASTFPVLSMITDQRQLFDEEDGVFVPGVRYKPELWTEDWWPPGNYRLSGREWEKHVHLQYFDADGAEVFSTGAGMRLNGQAIAAFPQKSLRFAFRKSYGNSEINFPYFEDNEVKTFRKILLRNSGNDCFSTLFRDAMLQDLIRSMQVETQRYSPSLLYINGEYWGVYNFRDRFDRHYFEDHYGLLEEEYDMIEGYEGTAVNGDNDVYKKLWKIIQEEDLSDTAVYARVGEYLDIPNFIDYNLIQTYFANFDWPANNVKAWRPRKEGGKFRFLIFDLDFCLGYNIMGVETDATFDMMAHSTAEDSEDWNNLPVSTIFFRKMMENEDFKTRFVCRYLELSTSTFDPNHINSRIDEFEARYAPEVQKHIERWQYPESVEAWKEQVDIMRQFANDRPEHFRAHLEAYLGTSLETVCPRKTVSLD